MIFHYFIIIKFDLITIINLINKMETENKFTTYDPIFEPTYWADTYYSKCEKLCINRNNFKEEFNIKGVRSDIEYRTPYGLGYKRFKEEINPEYPGNSTFDHFEVYERNDKLGFVAIFSPYHSIRERDEYYDNIVKLGYKKYHSSLYCTPCESCDCPTYIKLLPLKK